MDFDRAMKPPPHPTEESTTSLEDLIKRRIAEQQFDDPVRREPPPSDLQKELADLDDKRSAKVNSASSENQFSQIISVPFYQGMFFVSSLALLF